MPVDRSLGEDLASTLVMLYAQLQERMAVDLARRLALGMSAPDWAEKKLAQLGQLRTFGERLAAKLDGELGKQVEQALVLAYGRGGEAALEELAKLGGGSAQELAAIRRELPQSAAVQRAVFALASKLRGTHLRILRWQRDAYRQVIAEATITGTLQGVETRRRTAQRAWDRLLSQGITGFTDRSGRRWELASYVEMATRTATAQAAVEGHLDRLADRNVDLVIVSNAPQECKRCRPWEGKVLARSEDDLGPLTIRREHALVDGQTVRVEVAGSIREAVADGLMHPNCRHSLSAYLPGVTKPITHTQDPAGDRARQRLRELERAIRKYKLMSAAALDAEAKTRHDAKVREYQAKVRDHIRTAPTVLFRQSPREQIGAAR